MKLHQGELLFADNAPGLVAKLVLPLRKGDSERNGRSGEIA
jgi:hypothetical protein